TLPSTLPLHDALPIYSTQNAIDNKPTRVLRPRVIVYGLLLAALAVAWVVGVNTRSPLIVEVLRDRNALYRVAGGGVVQNDYTLRSEEHTSELQSRENL